MFDRYYFLEIHSFFSVERKGIIAKKTLPNLCNDRKIGIRSSETFVLQLTKQKITRFSSVVFASNYIDPKSKSVNMCFFRRRMTKAR